MRLWWGDGGAFAQPESSEGRALRCLWRTPNIQPRTSNIQRGKAAQSHTGAKAEGRMQNDEAGQSHPKPHQCDYKATAKRVDSQPIGTLLRPQSHLKAAPRLHQSHPNATLKLHQSHPKARERRSPACPRALAIVRIAEWAQLTAAPHTQSLMAGACERKSRNSHCPN